MQNLIQQARQGLADLAEVALLGLGVGAVYAADAVLRVVDRDIEPDSDSDTDS